MKKSLAIILSIVGVTSLLIVTSNDSIDLTSKLPLITSMTTLTGTYIHGGEICLQFTTVTPDKFSSKTKMTCKKRHN